MFRTHEDTFVTQEDETPETTESYEKKSGRDRFFRLIEEEMEILIDAQSGAIRSELAENTPCYLCGADQEQELFRKQGLRFVRCTRCGLAYMNPRPNRQALERLYAYESQANDAWVDVLLSDAEEEFQNRDFGELLDAVAQHRTGGGRLLDIGCSIGRLLNVARDRGYDVLGLELGERAAEIARQRYQLEVHSTTLEEAALAPESFAVVTLIETLEHLPEPRDMVREIHRLLEPGGIFLVGVPNGNSLGVMVLRQQARTFNRNHLIFFDEDTLSHFLQEEGFDVLQTMTTVSVLDSILNQLQGLDPFAAPQTRYLPSRLRRLVETPERRKLLEASLYDLGLGYRLRAVARKRD